MANTTLIKLMDYAENSGISIQTLGRKIDRYKKELDGHIITEGRTRFLDSYAVEFLDGKRAKGTVSVVVTDRSKEVEALNEKCNMLLEKLNASYEVLLAEQQKYTALLEEHTALKLSIAQKEQAEEPSEPGNHSEEGQQNATEATETDKAEQTEEVITKKENRFVRAWKELWK